MSETILRELRSSDVDWMASVGQQLSLPASEILLEAGAIANAMYLVLDGQFSLISIGSGRSQVTLATLTSGQVVGNLLLAQTLPLAYRVQAQEASLVLKIPQQILADKLEQDPCFSADFYRAIAQILATQHGQVVKALSTQALLSGPPEFKSIFSIFGCLQDSDMCWMLGAGQLKQLNPGEVCIQPGKSLDALYITLQGSLSIFTCDRQYQPLALAFGVKSQAMAEKEVSQILPGELVGVSQFLDFGQNFYTVRANPNALVLAIPLAALQQKIQQDAGFTARLYRAFSSLMAERTHQIFNSLNYSDVCYECGDSLRLDAEYGDEILMEDLQQTSLARARFNWMLKQLKIKE